MERPTKPCYVCGSSDWWLTPDGRWLCGKCHPNPNPGSSLGEEGQSEPASEPASALPSSALEVLALRDRVVKGNDKLFAAWQQIRELAGEEKEYQWDRWNEGQERLHFLCLELKRHYSDCLYLNEEGNRTKSCLSEGEWWCQVCPSSVPYWEQELMVLPGRRIAKTEQSEFEPGQKEFLEKLGEGKSEH